MNRGEVYDVESPGIGQRPAVVITRQSAIPFLRNVTVAVVTSTIRGLSTEVSLGPAHGLSHESVVNCDNLFTIPKRGLIRRRGVLGPAELGMLDEALATALGLD